MTPEELKAKAEAALAGYDRLKQEFAGARIQVQVTDDLLTSQTIVDAVKANGNEMNGLPAELLDLSARLKMARDNLERLWWDRKKDRSTVTT